MVAKREGRMIQQLMKTMNSWKYPGILVRQDHTLFVVMIKLIKIIILFIGLEDESDYTCMLYVVLYVTFIYQGWSD